jgi:hypothetical protein
LQYGSKKEIAIVYNKTKYFNIANNRKNGARLTQWKGGMEETYPAENLYQLIKKAII